MIEIRTLLIVKYFLNTIAVGKPVGNGSFWGIFFQNEPLHPICDIVTLVPSKNDIKDLKKIQIDTVHRHCP